MSVHVSSQSATQSSSTSDSIARWPASRRPRDLIGLIAASCEHAEGRPCGPGAALLTELDSSVGYDDWPQRLYLGVALNVQHVLGALFCDSPGRRVGHHLAEYVSVPYTTLKAVDSKRSP